MNDNDGRRDRRPAPSSRADLILHPVRMRIILALAGGGDATAGELAVQLPDVPPATLYRHLNTLRRGGLLAVTDERRVRGATERRFALLPGAGRFDPADLAAATTEDHVRWFASFLAGLLDAFGRYARQGTPDLARDGAGYTEVLLHLDDEELAAMSGAINGALARFLALPPSPGRVPRLLATVLIPSRPAAPDRIQETPR